MASVWVEATFDAAHQLPGHRGKCQFLHGHTYRVQVCVEGEVRIDPGDSGDGMVTDFGDVKRALKERVLARLDHTNLNEVLGCRTTAELVALWILKALEDVGVTAVRLWETPTSWAEVRLDDLRTLGGVIGGIQSG